MDRLILHVAAGILSIFLATKFQVASLKVIPGQSSLFGFQFTEFWQILVLVGAALGLVNFFIKPVLKLITLPLRIITFGLFSLIINVLIILAVDIIFPELKIEGLISLFWTSVIVWGISLILGVYQKK